MKKLISFIIITLLLFIFTPNTLYSSDKERAAPMSDKDAVEVTKDECKVKFTNATDKTYIFSLSWIDHPFLHQTRGKPWHKLLGEIKPGGIFIPTNNQAPGLYIITCRRLWAHDAVTITKEMIITAKDKTIAIILTPDGDKDPIILIFKYNT